MYTMVENVIVAGAENLPTMLKRSQYDSWQSRMLLYIRGKEHDLQLLDSIKNGPFQFETVDIPATRTILASTKKRTLADLTPEEKIREACDIRATNIILQSLPTDVYTLVNHHIVAKEIWNRVKLFIKGLILPLFLPSDDLIASLNKAMAFISIAFSSQYPLTNNQLKTSSNPKNQATIQDGEVIVENVQGRQTQSYTGWFKEKKLLAQAKQAEALPTTAIFQTDDLDAFSSDCNEASSASAVLMAKLSAYDSDVLFEVPNYDTYQDNNVTDQSVQEMQYSE
nr:hypothetical protein [Tanacetum cinerariifolium]